MLRARMQLLRPRQRCWTIRLRCERMHLPWRLSSYAGSTQLLRSTTPTSTATTTPPPHRCCAPGKHYGRGVRRFRADPRQSVVSASTFSHCPQVAAWVNGSPGTGVRNSIFVAMETTFLCARCSKPNASTSNLPAGSCDHATCRGLLCEACSDFHDTSKPPGHGFKWARDMDDDGDPAATVVDVPVKPSSPPTPPTPVTTAVPASPHDQSSKSMLAEMHTLQESIDAGVATVNAATSVRSLRCK